MHELSYQFLQLVTTWFFWVRVRWIWERSHSPPTKNAKYFRLCWCALSDIAFLGMTLHCSQRRKPILLWMNRFFTSEFLDLVQLTIFLLADLVVIVPFLSTIWYYYNWMDYYPVKQKTISFISVNYITVFIFVFCAVWCIKVNSSDLFNQKWLCGIKKCYYNQSWLNNI